MVDLNLTRVVDYTHKLLRTDLGTTLSNSKYNPVDEKFIREASLQISSTLDGLKAQGVIGEYQDIKAELIDDKLMIDVKFQPVFPVNTVNTIVTVDLNDMSTTTKEGNEEEERERRFQIYIENKSW